MQNEENRRQNVGSVAVLLALGVLATGCSGCSDRPSTAANVRATNMVDAANARPATGDPSTPGATQPTTTDAPVRPAIETEPASSATQQAVAARRQPARDITFDTIKFDLKKEEPFLRTMITPAIEKLNESKIRIHGYMLPSFQQTELKQFVLVRDNMECCFGPGAALYDCIVVEMEGDATAEYTTRPVSVEGVFSIRELRGPGNRCLAIYHLQGEKVR